MRFIVLLLIGVLLPAVISWLWVPYERWRCRRRGKHYDARDFVKAWIGNGVVNCALWSADSMPPLGIGCGISAVIALIVLLWMRRGRRRAPRSFGAKSRARLEAVVQRMRQQRVPRRVWEPS